MASCKEELPIKTGLIFLPNIFPSRLKQSVFRICSQHIIYRLLRAKAKTLFSKRRAPELNLQHLYPVH